MEEALEELLLTGLADVLWCSGIVSVVRGFSRSATRLEEEEERGTEKVTEAVLKVFSGVIL